MRYGFGKRLLLIAACLGVSSAIPALAQSAMPQLMRPVYHDVSRPLWEMSAFAIPAAGQPKEGPEVEELPLHRWPAEKDPVVQGAMGTTLAAAPGLNFDGIGQGAYGFSVMYAPTDSNGAVGATQYVEWQYLITDPAVAG